MPTVFISYRREDTSANAGRLCDWLKRHFGANVFLDTESIAPGDAFPTVLEERLAASNVLLAVIGPRWAGTSDGAGNRRLFDPKDFVALEVSTALKRGIRVIPVLVGGASMPSADQLPPALQGFEKKNAVSIDDSRFAQDFDNLVDAIVGRKRGFARRELDRFQRGARVVKAGSLIAPVLATFLLLAAWMQAFDALLLDTRVASYSMWLGQLFVGPPRDSSVVLIAIDEDSEKRLGRKYGRAPEWRLDHAKMIDRLSTAGVAAVAFDFYIEDENEGEGSADKTLADAIRQATQKGVRIIIGIRATTGAAPRLLPVLLDAGAEPGSLCIGTRLGYAFSVPIAVSSDSRGVRALRVSNSALGLLAAIAGRPEAIDEERREVSVRDGSSTRFVAYSLLEDARVPSNDCPTLGAGSVIASLLLRLSPGGFWREPQRHMSYAQVLDRASPSSRPESLRGKIALIGVTLAEVGDLHSVVRGWQHEQVFGVELHADTIANLEQGVAVRLVGPIAQYLFMLALAAAGAAMSFLLFDRAARHRRVALALALAVYLGTAVLFYVTLSILFNVLYDITAFAVAYIVLSHLQNKAVAEPVEEALQ